MANAERFLEAFNAIEEELRRQRKSDQYITFSDLVRASPKLVSAQQQLLLKWAQLRNVIVHTPRGRSLEVIADPRSDIVSAIEQQLEVLARPPKVLDVLHPVPPVVLNSEQSVYAFLEQVALPRDFSQSPVRMPDGTLSLITTNAFARWVASYYEPEGAAIDDAPISHVLAFGEPGDAIRMAPRTLTAVEGWRIFSGQSGATPAALGVTESGKTTETLLALIVRADVPDLLSALHV